MLILNSQLNVKINTMTFIDQNYKHTIMKLFVFIWLTNSEFVGSIYA